MPGPWKHPTTHVYYFRKAVPDRLRALVGRREEKRSLRTKDLTVARQVYLRVASQVVGEWETLLSQAPDLPVARPRQSLTQKQASQLAGRIYRDMIARHQDDPGTPQEWDKSIRKLQLALRAEDRAADAPQQLGGFANTPDQVAARLFGSKIKEYLGKEGIDIDYPSLMKLAPAVARNVLRASQQLARNARGNYAPDPFVSEIPVSALIGPPYTVDELVREYAAFNKIGAKSIKKYTGVMKQLMRFLKTDDLRSVSEDDILLYVDHRVLGGLSNKTIRDGDLAAAKALFSFAKKKKKIASNPVADVTIKVPTSEKLRDQGFTLEEAIKILSATRQDAGKNMTVEGAAARRWVPWLCAYTGARVNEITQARADDVYAETMPDGAPIWVVRITPEAGTVKNKSARVVPLHLHIVDQGFLEYVRSRSGKPLFYDPARARGGSPAHLQSNKAGERLAAWVRKIGITDLSIRPNHAWRHRFSSVATSLDIPERITDAILGHSAQSVARQYGDNWLWVLHRHIMTMPAYNA